MYPHWYPFKKAQFVVCKQAINNHQNANDGSNCTNILSIQMKQFGCDNKCNSI